MKFTDRLREEVSWYRGKDALAQAEAANIIDELEMALRDIAAYHDEWAEMSLKKTGSYSSFDEPGSVQIAREALAKLEKLNRD